MRLYTREQVLAELAEDELSALYVRMVELVEGSARLPTKMATHGLETLRDQLLLSRVDGAGLVRAGAYSLTRLGAAIADFWLEDESLTRQSLVLLTTALRSQLGELLSAAESASTEEEWERVRQVLRVHVASLVEGIDRRRRGLDEQQAAIQKQVGKLLEANWVDAIEQCELLLEETTSTLAELKDVLMRETGELLNLLVEIESFAGAAVADEVVEAAREAQLRIDGIAAWGRARHEAWSEYFGSVQRFIRDHVRMDPDRALSRRLQKALAAWPDDPWFVHVPDPVAYLHLREPEADRPRVAVRRAARDRESVPEWVQPSDWEREIEAKVRSWLADHEASTLAEVLGALLPDEQRFRLAGRITRLLAIHGLVEASRERSWAPVGDDLMVEQWLITRRKVR